MTQDLQPRRRGFLAAAASFAAAPVAALNLLSPTAARAAGAAGSGLGTIKQIDAGVLNVGYAEAGPADGPPVVLLHGWPYDIRTYVDVAPLLAQQGYRVIVPFLRGYGGTRFLSSSHGAHRAAGGGGAGHRLADGRAGHPPRHRGRLRLGCAHGLRRGRAVAGAGGGAGVRQRLPAGQPRRRPPAADPARASCPGGTSST